MKLNRISDEKQWCRVITDESVAEVTFPNEGSGIGSVYPNNVF
jgi:hypothetical protein